MHNFKLANLDTDSISFSKSDGAPFTEEEQSSLLKELNSLFPSSIKWEHDGIFSKVVIIKAKNYILKDGKGKVKIKGSALKVTLKEVALKEFVNKVIDSLLNDKISEIKNIYESYVKEIYNLKDIGRWCSKKTITGKVLAAERTTEQKVSTAIQDSEYVEGDKCYMYFRKDESLSLQENWKQDHDEEKLLEKLYKTIVTFETVLDLNEYPNFSLKKNLNAGRVLGGLEPLEKKPRKNAK